MPTQKRFRCLRCTTEFNLDIFTPDEQAEARHRNPNQGFGPARCINPQCQSTDLMDSEMLKAS